jgi:hypothetical protein
MEDSINQLKSKASFKVYFRTLWDSAPTFIKRVTRFFTLTEQEKAEAGILLPDKYFKK